METLRTTTDWFAVDDATVAGSVRRAVIRMANRLGFTESRAAEAGIVGSEISANLWRHAQNGSVALQVALHAGDAGIRIVGIDHGPGMSDLVLAGTDGHSTSGTLGVGLGAIARLSTRLDVSSAPGKGTLLAAELWPSERPAPPPVDVGGLTRAMAGEEVCGDAVAGREVDGHQLLMVSDGLGHGPLAAAASAEALSAFHAAPSADPTAVLTGIHNRIKQTRGAALAVASTDPAFRTMRFAGVGNISAFVVGADGRQAALSFPGIVGHQLPRLRPVELVIPPDGLIVMHSDGVRETWNLRDVPGLFRRTSAVIAAAVLRDAGNRPDDASVLVARRRG